jgi:hypothetical protein
VEAERFAAMCANAAQRLIEAVQMLLEDADQASHALI